MASGDAITWPKKNQAYRVTFPILDADGDLVSDASSLDSERSIDGANFADCTNEATEIEVNSGVYYLDLNASEMNGDCIAIIVKSGNGKTTPIVLYPAQGDLDDIYSDTTVLETGDATLKSDVVAIEIDADNTYSDTTVLETSYAALVSDAAAIEIDADNTYSDTTVLETSYAALISDAAAAESEIIVVHSDTLAIEADTGNIFSDTTILEASYTQLVSDAAAAESEIIVVHSDTLAIEADTGNIYSDTTVLETDVSDTHSETTKILVDTEDIQSRLPAALSAGNIKADMLAISADTTAADNLELSTNVILVAAAAAGTLSTTEMTTTLTSAVDDFYNGRIVIFTSGALTGQATDITDYTGATKLVQMTAVTVAPGAGDDFIIV